MPWDTIEGAFAAAENGDIDSLQLIYAAGFLLLRYTGQITQDVYQVLRSALLMIADDLEHHAEVRGDSPPDRPDVEKIRSTVLPDLDALWPHHTDTPRGTGPSLSTMCGPVGLSLGKSLRGPHGAPSLRRHIWISLLGVARHGWSSRWCVLRARPHARRSGDVPGRPRSGRS
ncbi:hypothetical protein GCM10027026_12000 [Myroides odoratimimus subsp. xuanwuensis]